jgi:hypothetical protein
VNLGAYCLLDHFGPGVRDPEYGRRLRRLRSRIAEHPDRPSVVCLGSSRIAMGICPAAWESWDEKDSTSPKPLLLNLGLQGSGPILELLALRRLLADGVTPHAILVEYWPPFLDGDPRWAEATRMAPHRLMDIDRPVVREFLPNSEQIEREMDRYRTAPLYANRECLLIQMAPNWLPRRRRTDDAWSSLDPWGWLPGGTEPQPAAQDACRKTYEPLFASYQLASESSRAFQEIAITARKRGVKVAWIYLPESSSLRSWYSAAAELAATGRLTALSRELSIPVINARMWMDDDSFVDGVHLMRSAAAAFTRKMAPVVRSTFER